MKGLKKQGCTVIVITHRSNILSQVDDILLLVNGEAALYGPRDKILTALQQSAKKSQVIQSGPPASYTVKTGTLAKPTS